MKILREDLKKTERGECGECMELGDFLWFVWGFGRLLFSLLRWRILLCSSVFTTNVFFPTVLDKKNETTKHISSR